MIRKITLPDSLSFSDYFKAKDENLERGFKQLAVEMVALAHILEEEQRYIYGAVSIGKIWQFGVLDRLAKSAVQDLHLYRVPDDLRELMSILVAILNGEISCNIIKEN